MNIILLKDFSALGKTGEIVAVKDGYARNYLIPEGIAAIADKSAMKVVETKKRQVEAQLVKERRAAEKIADSLSKVSLTVKMTAGEEDKIFGSVTSQNIIDLLKEKGVDIDKRKIHLEEPIKALGVYQVPIKLSADVTAKVKLFVIKEE